MFAHVDSWDRVPQTISGGQWVQFLAEKYVPVEAYPEAQFKMKFEGTVPGVNPEEDDIAAASNEGLMSMEEMKAYLTAETPKSAELMLKHGVITEQEFEALGIPLKALTPGFRSVRMKRAESKSEIEVRGCT